MIMKTRRGVLGAWVAGVLVAAVFAIGSRHAEAQSKVRLDDPIIYQVNLNGLTGWDVTPELIANIFFDADRNFSDLIHVHNPGPDSPDQVVQAEAWPNHVVVLRLDLSADPRATHLDPRAYAARFERVVREQVDLRNRRVALWVRRANDDAAFMVSATPEVFLIPGAESTISDAFADRYSRGNEAMTPEAPSLDDLPECTTHADLVRALGMPEETKVIYGDSQRILDRWAQFRDDAIDMAEGAVGDQWNEYERIIADENAPEFKKITARRDIEQTLKRAHTMLIRSAELGEHPVVKPLAEKVLAKIKELSETPRPGR